MTDNNYEIDFTNTFINACPSTSTTYYVRLRYKETLVWASVSGNYESIKLKASQCFPELLGSSFNIRDSDGAIINEDFINDFLNISNKGVILSFVKDDEVIEQLPTERNINSPAFSTYSLAYTGGVSSASTETLQSLPTSPAPSDICSNFDEDDDSYSLIVSPTGKKRLKTSSISYHNLTDHEFKNYVLSDAWGKQVISYYKENRTLDDKHRIRLVHIAVDHMLQFMPPNTLPSAETRTQYAKCIVTLFPKLKDVHTDEGYEAFRGFIVGRLRTVFRDKKVKKGNSTIQENSTVSSDEYDESVQETIEFLKAATQEQIKDIFERTRQTFDFRNSHRQDIDKLFPRFFDTPGLISLEFSLMFPENDIFHKTFSKNISIIKKLYTTTATNINTKFLHEENKDPQDWNASTNAILMLVYLLPPTSSKNARKQSAATAANKLIIFKDMQVPFTTILKERPSKQPFILAIGTSKAAINYVDMGNWCARKFASVVQQLRDHGTFNFKLTIVAVIGQKEEVGFSQLVVHPTLKEYGHIHTMLTKYRVWSPLIVHVV
ncbi:hypothetical protein Zmor_023716 [Zophobas morio]|uniref:Uncharacterized protein n=1 Tax=Zophobas morio TaxID=2755281 RepID=A0AA38HZR1_9CUCU|nr:hypothetical protein Zmor_023716 [Zophobas morio]